MKKEIEGFQAQAVERAAQRLVEKAREVNGVKVITSVVPMAPAAAKDLAFKIRAAVNGSLLCVIGSHDNNKKVPCFALSVLTITTSPSSLS